MFLVDKTYLKPNKTSRILAILENLSLDPELSQAELGRRTSLSSAMINAYLKDLNGRGWLQLTKVNGKAFKYELTASGDEQRRQMLGQYMAEIVQIYTALKTSILKKIASLIEAGTTRVALFGASETGEIVLSVLQTTSLKVLAVMDNDPNKHGESFHGFVIAPPEILSSLSCQAVLISSFARHQEIVQQIRPKTEHTNMQIITL